MSGEYSAVRSRSATNILKAMAMTGTRIPTPLNRMGTPNMHQSVPLQEQGGQYQQDPKSVWKPCSGCSEPADSPAEQGLTRKTLHSLRETHMLVSPSQQHRQRQTLLLKLSRMFGAASLMSLRASRATHIKRLQDSQPWGWIIAVAAQSFAGSLVITQLVSGLLGLSTCSADHSTAAGGAPLREETLGRPS